MGVIWISMSLSFKIFPSPVFLINKNLLENAIEHSLGHSLIEPALELMPPVPIRSSLIAQLIEHALRTLVRHDRKYVQFLIAGHRSRHFGWLYRNDIDVRMLVV